jgi:inosine-uridine nucleoside N-ribohydrolase
MRHVILDTDIGTDVDDLLALIFLAHASELRLEGVTTVYGDTLLRARIAAVAWQRTGNPEIPIIPGAAEPLSGAKIFWCGHEGEGIPSLEIASVDRSRVAEQFLIHNSNIYSGQLEVLTIGPLTNIANTILRDAGFASRIKRLYLMGGAYWLGYPEHNIECDHLAARIVFGSGIPITAIGLDVTLKIRLSERELMRIRELPNGLGPMLEYQIRRWWKYLGANHNYLHDPLAALAMVRPDLFLFENCEVRIRMDQHMVGRLERFDNPNGNVSAAFDLYVNSAEKMLFNYIIG